MISNVEIRKRYWAKLSKIVFEKISPERTHIVQLGQRRQKQVDFSLNGLLIETFLLSFAVLNVSGW